MEDRVITTPEVANPFREEDSRHDYKAEENAIRERMLETLKRKGIAFSRLSAGDTGLQSQLQRQLKAGAAVSCNTLLHFFAYFPDVSIVWLLTGDASQGISTPEQGIAYTSEMEALMQQNRKLMDRVLWLLDRVEDM